MLRLELFAMPVSFCPPPQDDASSVASSSSPHAGVPMAYRAQLGRFGSSRWGWVLQLKIHATIIGSLEYIGERLKLEGETENLGF